MGDRNTYERMNAFNCVLILMENLGKQYNKIMYPLLRQSQNYPAIDQIKQVKIRVSSYLYLWEIGTFIIYDL